MAEKDFLEMRGTIEESLPAGKFRVTLENGLEVTAYLAGKLRQNRIRVMPGDDVKCEVSPYDLTKARITFRF
jgi:translation initiation factor IF-1